MQGETGVMSWIRMLQKIWKLIMHSSRCCERTQTLRSAFDPTLVRGMSYYTGPIFEIAMDEFGGSCRRRRTLR